MDPRTAAFVWATAAPPSAEPVLELLVATFRAFEERPARMLVTAGDAVKKSACNEAKLATAVRSKDTRGITAIGAGSLPLSISVELRDDERYDERFRSLRYAEVQAPVIAPDDERLEALLRMMCAAYPVSQGGVFRAATERNAIADSGLLGGNKEGTEEERRIAFDVVNSDQATTKLRRLYPVTIVGPTIWATLPPLPDVEPPVTVRDLGDCKMLTAWPTLVDTYDPQFLLGTRALREWLWPHTIQNPADDPASIDARLKWLELLPW